MEKLNKNKLIISIVVVIIVGVGTFFGGMKYGESKNLKLQGAQISAGNFRNLSPEQRQQMMQQFNASNGASRQPNTGGQRTGAGFISGEIISKDDKSITVKIPNGGSKIIFFASSTKISKLTDGSINDLEIGKNITVNGAANQDGSITAQTIQLR